MRAMLLGLALGVVLLAAPGHAPAQKPAGKPRPDEPYTEFFRPPSNPEEFWRAIQFELDVGQFEQAARALRGLVASNPGDQDLVDLNRKAGSAGLLRLRSVPRWSDDPARNKQALQDVEELAKRMSGAVQRVLGDEKRHAELIAMLTGDQAERNFAAGELYRARDAAIPALVRTLRTGENDQRAVILNLLPRLSNETVPPLTAALDLPDDQLRQDLIDVLVKRNAVEAVPYLWWLAGSPQTTPAVRQRAVRALETLLDRPPGTLPAPAVALTREAERFARGQAAFPDRSKVTVWRVDGNELVRGWPGAATVPASQAEEYYGLRFARQALEINPSFEPAQLVFLTLALDKAQQRAGLGRPATQADPRVQKLLATVSPRLIIRVLEQALEEHRVPVILAATQALGDLGETRAYQPSVRGEPPLLRALNYPDRRVQTTAAEAMLRIPTPPPVTAAARVVDILARNAALQPAAGQKPKVLIGMATDAQNQALADSARKAGYEPVTVRTGREMLKRLAAAPDIDAILLDPELPDPGLSHLVGQLRADLNAAGVPIWLVLPSETRESLRLRRLQIDQRLADLPAERRILDRQKAYLTTQLDHVGYDREREKALRGELDRVRNHLASTSFDAQMQLVAQREAVDRELLTAPCEYGLSIRRWAEKHRNVHVLPEEQARSPELLRQALAPALGEAHGTPLTEAERRDYAERALRWLDRIARGEVPGFDFRPAGDVLIRVLQAPAPVSVPGLLAAIDAVGRLPGARPQTELAALVLDPRRTPEVRAAAAQALRRHIQTHSPALRKVDVLALQDLLSADGTPPLLREDVALVLGSLQPDPRRTAERLINYDPSPTKPTAPPDKPAPGDKPGDKP